MNKSQKYKKVKEYTADYYTQDELLNLMEIIETTPIELPVIIAGVYGLRREEVIGIKWNAIDFKDKTLTIRHTVGRGKIDGVTQFIFKERTKSDAGYRTLPLFDFIADLLRKYKNKYEENKKFYGNTYCNDYKDYICLMENGELMKPGYITQTFSKILDNNHLRHIRLHDLRHSCGTLLVRNGVPLKDIQIWLGHSNFPDTPDISSFKKLMKNRDEKIQEQIIKPKDKAIKELQEQNTLLTLTLNKQMKTVDKAVKYEKEFKPILEENIELKEKYETLENTYNLKLQEEKTKIQDKYENRIYNLEKENNFLRKVINTFQKTVHKFIEWVCIKFSITDENSFVRKFELENDTYINPIKQIEHEEELEYTEFEI